MTLNLRRAGGARAWTCTSQPLSFASLLSFLELFDVEVELALFQSSSSCPSEQRQPFGVVVVFGASNFLVFLDKLNVILLDETVKNQ
jgi:hypothetical protein